MSSLFNKLRSVWAANNVETLIKSSTVSDLNEIYGDLPHIADIKRHQLDALPDYAPETAVPEWIPSFGPNEKPVSLREIFDFNPALLKAFDKDQAEHNAAYPKRNLNKLCRN